MHANPSTSPTSPTSPSAGAGGAILLAGLFWGAIWGLYEATVGYLVHAFVRMPGTSAVLLVPFAVYCMVRATSAAGTVRAAGLAAAVAASIKLVDLLLPNLTPLAVLNPAMAIALEGLVFMGVASWLRAPQRLADGRGLSAPSAALGALVFSLGWRVLFLAWSAALAAGWSAGIMAAGWVDPVLRFLVRDGGLSAAVILAVLAVAFRGGRVAAGARAVPGPAVVAAVVVLAVAAEVAVGLLG